MPLFSPEQPVINQTLQEKRELRIQKRNAARAELRARRAEKRSGRFLARMLDDLRNNLNSRRERRVIQREEQQLRIRNKWAKVVWRDPMY